MISDQSAGRAATLTIELKDANDAQINASAVTWKLYDQTGALVASAAVSNFTALSPSVTFTIPETAMAIEDNESFSGREIVLACETASGEVEVRDYFILVAQHPLKPFSNTLLTYLQALALRRQFGPTLSGWDEASEEDQKRSLMHAFANLARISFTVALPAGRLERDYAAYGTGSDDIFEVSKRVSLGNMTAERFAELNSSFKNAVVRAQLIEADTILGGDPVERTRSDGIISESIGESSTFYQSRPSLQLPIGRRAFEILKPWIRFKVSIVR